jgi:adenosylmethionine-8-amino-7-oxononanoate aminotransferase
VLDAAIATGHLFTIDPRRNYPVLDRAEGVHVWDTMGHRYLDAIAGVGVANIGYGRREVVEAMSEQALRLPFAVPNIFSNEPAMRLAEALARHTPADLDHVVFTSGGSEAIEVAIKMARQYHVERGKLDKHLIVGRWTSYHGATIAGLSAGGSNLRRRKYAPLLIDFPHIPPIYCYRCPWGLSYPTCALPCADDLERLILEHGADKIAAFIAEPVVASVGGAISPQPEYFPRIREICDRYDVLFIADEVVTGLGRTGRPFALDHWGVSPDLLVMGKGVSGGYAPLGAVAATRKIRQTFVETGAVFEHIFTFGGNPISTAAGLAVLRIWEDEDLVANVSTLESYFRDSLKTLLRFGFVGDVRAIGFMAGIEFVSDRETRLPFAPERRVAALVRDTALSHGVITYPGNGMADGVSGDIVSLYPPLTFTRANIDEMTTRLTDALVEVERTLSLTGPS